MKKRLLAIGAVAAFLLCAAAIAGSAETPAGTRAGEIILISESDAPAADLTAFRQGQAVALDALDWADGGVHGQALRLDGQTEYLEYTGDAVRSQTLAGAAWINWQGSATGDESGEIGQRLWTLYRDENNYFSICLRAYRDNIREAEDGTVFRVDGVYMEYKLAGAGGRLVEGKTLTARDIDYAIPRNVWTHLAFTLDNKTMRLYIGGRLWYEEALDNAATLLNASVLQIGGSLDGGPTLNARIDDAALFTQGLDAADIRALAQGAALDFTGATEPTTYRPTRPAEPESEPDLDADEEESSLHIPTFAWIVVGAFAAVIVIAIIAVNLKAKREDDT